MRVDLEPHPAGDLESGVATRPASSAAAAAAAAAALQQQQQRIPPARSRRGHAAHQKKHREEAVLTRRPAQHQHQPHASLQHVDWHTSLRHICTASSRWNLRSRRAVVVAQWPQLRPRTPGRGQRARRPVAGTASERDQRHRARAKDGILMTTELAWITFSFEAGFAPQPPGFSHSHRCTYGLSVCTRIKREFVLPCTLK